MRSSSARSPPGLPADQRKKVILIGVIAALVLRIVLRADRHPIAADRRADPGRRPAAAVGGVEDVARASPRRRKRWRLREIDGDEHSGLRPAKSFAGAAWAVAIADVSMSLDNVLAVAGAAREHPGILIVGLIFAVALMGIAANVIAKYIERYRWIAYVGLLVILYVAGKMIWEGWIDPQVGARPPVRLMPGERAASTRSSRCRAAARPRRSRSSAPAGPRRLPRREALAGPLAAAAPGRAADLARSRDGRADRPRRWSCASTAPTSATGEDIVEYQCHGGRAVVDALLAALAASTGHARGRAGRIHPPRLRQRPDRPDRGRGPRRSARGRDRSPAPRRAAARRGRAAAPDRGLAGAAGRPVGAGRGGDRLCRRRG